MNRITALGCTHDAAGNITNDHGVTYTWNAEGRLAATAGTGVVGHFASLEAPLLWSGEEVYPTLFRKYHSRMYRWLSPDPIAGDNLNPPPLPPWEPAVTYGR